MKVDHIDRSAASSIETPVRPAHTSTSTDGTDA